MGQDGTHSVQDLIDRHLKDDPRTRRQLFVAMLYHDIAKGRPGRHEVVGAELAPAICARLGLDGEDTARVAWLIGSI